MLSFEKCKCTRKPLKAEKPFKCPLLKTPGDCILLFYESATKNPVPLKTVRSKLLTNTAFQRTPAITPALKHISIDKDVLFLTISLSKMLSMCSCRAWNIVWALRGMREITQYHNKDNDHRKLVSSCDMKQKYKWILLYRLKRDSWLLEAKASANQVRIALSSESM